MSRKIQENLSSWREFREYITKFDDDKKIREVVKYFSSFPIVNYVLDYNTPEKWISPWEIISDDYYDDIALVILMCETLVLSNFNTNRFKLRYVTDTVDNSSFMILIIDDHKVLNFSYNQIVNYDDIKNRIRIIEKIERTKDSYRKE
mgnify:CR=1 FL=1